MSQQDQKQIAKYFPNRPILYLAGLSIVLDSVNAGLMMSQLIFWSGKGGKKDGWIYKTMAEFKQETGLSRTQQETAIRICKEHGFIDYKLAGIPAKRHFKVNLKKIENMLPSLKESAKIHYPNPPLQYAGNLQTITENTQETTTKTTKEASSGITSLKEEIEKKRGRLT